MVIAAFIMSGCSVYFKLCPHGYLLEEWYGSYLANYRWTRWTAWFLSYVTMTIATVETIQMIGMMITFLPTIVLTWEKITDLTSQLAVDEQFAKIIANYRQLQIVGGIGRDFVLSMLFIFVSTVSILTPGFVYVAIKMALKMPTGAYLCVPYILQVIFFLSYFLLRAIERVSAKWMEGLTNLRRGKVRSSLEWRVVNSIPIFTMQYGLPGNKLMDIGNRYKTKFYAGILDNTLTLLLSFRNP